MTIVMTRPTSGNPVTICGTSGLMAIPQKPTAIVDIEAGKTYDVITTTAAKYAISPTKNMHNCHSALASFLMSLTPRYPRYRIK
jgi:hypothetical protein